MVFNKHFPRSVEPSAYSSKCSCPSSPSSFWTVARARRLQRFLAQPTHVAEKFTGIPGVYVPLKDTLESFAAIVDGELDQYPEAAFYNVGTWRDVVEKARKMEAGEL